MVYSNCCTWGLKLSVHRGWHVLFETNEAYRHQLGSALAGEQGHAWTQVKLDRFTPFFLLGIGPSRQSLAETWLLATPEDLLSRYRQVREASAGRLVSVCLISPSRLNRSSQWRIEPMVELWEGQGSQQSDPVYRYVLADGRVYSSDAITSDSATSWKQLL